MTAPSKERVETLRAKLGRDIGYRGNSAWRAEYSPQDIADLLAILDGREKMAAELDIYRRIDRVKIETSRKLYERADKAEAQIEKQRPLIEAVMGCYAEDLEYCVNLYRDNPEPDPALNIIRAALAHLRSRLAEGSPKPEPPTDTVDQTTFARCVDDFDANFAAPPDKAKP